MQTNPRRLDLLIVERSRAAKQQTIYFGTLGSLLDIQHSSDILPRAVTE